MNYSSVVVRPEQFVVLTTTRTNNGTLSSVRCSSWDSCAEHGQSFRFRKDLGWTTPSHAFFDTGNIASGRSIRNRRHSLLSKVRFSRQAFAVAIDTAAFATSRDDTPQTDKTFPGFMIPAGSNERLM